MGGCDLVAAESNRVAIYAWMHTKLTYLKFGENSKCRYSQKKTNCSNREEGYLVSASLLNDVQI